MKKNSRETTLVKNTLIITIGKICTQLITFFLLPLYTGILTTEEYGTIDLLNTLVSLLLPLVTFQTEQAVFRDLLDVREDELKRKKIVASAFYSILIQCIFYIILFMIISPFVMNQYKYFLATNVIVFIFSSLFLQVARGLGDNKKYAIGSFLSAFSTIFFNILFLLLIKLRANGILLGTMLGQVVCILYSFMSLKLYNYINIKFFDRNTVKKLWRYSVPLIPNAISWWIFNASDRVIVSTILGLSSTGLLSASSKFSGVYITLYNIFNMSWTESISIHINDEDIKEYFNNMFNLIMKIFISICIIMIACMPIIYPIMIDFKFHDGYNLVPILIIASLFNVIVGLTSVIYVAKKKTKEIANTSVISAIINITVHLILIKFIGLYAAVISTFVAFFTMSIYRIKDISKKYFKINLEMKTIILSVIVLFFTLITYYINIVLLNIISLVIAVIFSIHLNYKSINFIIKFILKKNKGDSINE